MPPNVVTVAGICNSVGSGVFFDMPPRWRISVGVKARVVNRYPLAAGRFCCALNLDM